MSRDRHREGDREVETAAVLAVALGSGALIAVGALSWPAIAVGALAGTVALLIVALRVGSDGDLGEPVIFALLLAAALAALAYGLGELGPWADAPEQFKSIWTDRGRLSLLHLTPGVSAFWREPMGWLPSAAAAAAVAFALVGIVLQIGLAMRSWGR